MMPIDLFVVLVALFFLGLEYIIKTILLILGLVLLVPLFTIVKYIFWLYHKLMRKELPKTWKSPFVF